MDIESLSNSELRQTLIDHGIDAGPVTSTTRKLYTKKLAKVYQDNSGSMQQTTFENNYEENISYVEQTSQSTSYYEQEQLSHTPQVERISQTTLADDVSETSSTSLNNSSSKRDYYPRSFTPSDRNLKRRPLPQLYKESTPITSKSTEKITVTKETTTVDGKVIKDGRPWYHYCQYILPLLIFLLLLGLLIYSHLEDDTFKMLPFGNNKNKIH